MFFSRQRSLVWVDWGHRWARIGNSFCVIYVVTYESRVYPANISANGYDKGVPMASPIIIRPFLTWNWSHHFSSLFLALTAWFEILADNVLSIVWWSLDPRHRVRVITAVLPLEWEVSKCCVVLYFIVLVLTQVTRVQCHANSGLWRCRTLF